MGSSSFPISWSMYVNQLLGETCAKIPKNHRETGVEFGRHPAYTRMLLNPSQILIFFMQGILTYIWGWMSSFITQNGWIKPIFIIKAPNKEWSLKITPNKKDQDDIHQQALRFKKFPSIFTTALGADVCWATRKSLTFHWILVLWLGSL